MAGIHRVINSSPKTAYLSQDWRVESVIYQGVKKELGSQRSFVPRIGELVLFHRGKAPFPRLRDQKGLSNMKFRC